MSCTTLQRAVNHNTDRYSVNKYNWMFPHQELFPHGACIRPPPLSPYSNYVTGWKIQSSITDRGKRKSVRPSVT